MSHNKVGKKCPRCGKQIQMGYNGIWLYGKPLCDNCAGVKRDADGMQWDAHETAKTLYNPETGETRVVARPEGL